MDNIILNTLFDSLNQASRKFEYDYIYFDAFFLVIWLGVFIKQKKWNPLKFSIIAGIIIYILDTVIWFNAPAGPNYPPGTKIREYWIGGTKIPTPPGEYFWLKFGADFMMCISYSFFAFGWVWIMFENYGKKSYRERLAYTVLFFGSWMLIPLLSALFSINDTEVYTIRHMDTQLIAWFVNVIVGYTLLFIIYGSGKLRNRDFKLIGYVFIIGLLESFFMVFPLYIFRIRPMKPMYFIYELFFLFNQGAPYLYILQREVLPFLRTKIKRKKEEELLVPLARS